MASSYHWFCPTNSPKPNGILFTVILKREKQQIVTFKKLLLIDFKYLSSALYVHDFHSAHRFVLFTHQSFHTMVKQITVEELFGSSFPKDPSLPTMPTQNTTASSSDPSTAYLRNQSYPTSAHQNPLPPHLAAQDPGSNQRHQAPGLLPAPYVLHHPSPVFQSVVPRSDPQPRCSVSPLMVPAAGSEPGAAPSGPAAPSAAPTAYLGQEILSTLKQTAPCVNSDMPKPILAPNFLPSTLFPPHSFQEPMGKLPLQHSKEMDVFSQPPNLIKPMSVSSVVFLPPVFVALFAEYTHVNVLSLTYSIFLYHERLNYNPACCSCVILCLSSSFLFY